MWINRQWSVKKAKIGDYRYLSGAKFRYSVECYKNPARGPIVKSSGQVTRAWLTNQIRRFRIPAIRYFIGCPALIKNIRKKRQREGFSKSFPSWFTVHFTVHMFIFNYPGVFQCLTQWTAKLLLRRFSLGAAHCTLRRGHVNVENSSFNCIAIKHRLQLVFTYWQGQRVCSKLIVAWKWCADWKVIRSATCWCCSWEGIWKAFHLSLS